MQLGKEIREPIAKALERVRDYLCGIDDQKLITAATYEDRRENSLWREGTMYMFEDDIPDDVDWEESFWYRAFTSAYYGENSLNAITRDNKWFVKFVAGGEENGD